jgi:glycosyltransferase involved in cell wall biosynthesis
VFTIQNGIDIDVLPPRAATGERDIPVFISGLKNPEFARTLGNLLSREGCPAQVEVGLLPRREFLDRLRRAQIAVLLPLESEGFYLPALEAMALGAVVVCPDCVGNRSFCKDGYNCFVPAYSVKDISMVVHRTRALSPDARTQLAEAARHTADMHGLARERDAFLRIMRNLDQLW